MDIRSIVVAFAFVAGVVLPSAATSCSSSPVSGATGHFERHSYTDDDAGTRTYKVYVPSSYDPDPDPEVEPLPIPLMVELHGCGSDADEEARWSRLNDLAETERFLVAYPEQDPAANGSQCWNWFLPEHQTRVGGEPAIIAGITRTVMETWNVDPRRVYIGGVSAGAAMSVNMAVTYPDLYAAAMVYAGCEYMGTTCTAAVAVLPPEVSGMLAYQEMGERARVVPVIVIQGTADAQVPAPNAELVVQQFLAMADWADDGDNDGSISRFRSSTRSGQEPGGWPWEVDTYTTEDGCRIAERWLIHGHRHAWSKGGSDGSPRDTLLTDPLGPDVTTPLWEFLISHPMPEPGETGCI